MKKKKTHKKRTSTQAYEDVSTGVKNVLKAIFKAVNVYPPQERWLVAGRIINSVFCHHYGMSMNVADAETAAHESRRAGDK